MPVFLKTLNIYNEFRNEPVDWLLANIGDKIRIETTIDVSTYAIASTDNPIIYTNTDGYVGSGWVTGGDFSGVKIGDTLLFFNRTDSTSFSVTVIGKLSDAEIQINAVGVPTDQSLTNYNISVSTPITAIRYKWNFIENNDQPTFASLVDGTIQELVHRNKLANDTSVSTMEFLGSKPYQIGNATIEGVLIDSSTGVYVSRYKIIHYTYLTPFFLSQQWQDLLNSTAPDYYFNTNALKAIFDFEAQYNFTDPNRIQTEEITEIIGNSGWYNENFNTGISNYFIDSVVYKRADTTVISAIELITGETTVEVVVKNTIDSPFSNNNTKFTLNFIKAPFNAQEYQGNARTMDVNFCFDRKLQTVGSVAANGDNFGGTNQVLKDIEATFISASEIKITAKIAMVQDVIDVISESDERQYILWVAVQKHSLATSLADKVALKIDAKNFYEDASDPTMIILSNKFIRHFETASEGTTDLNVFPEDEVVASSQFYVDKNGRLDDIIVLNSATARIKAKNSVTGAEFSLDTFTIQLFGAQVINGNQYVSLLQDRVFHIPAGDIRKQIRVERRIDLDNSDKYYYDFSFPFLVRWEYWVALANANGIFFNPSQPNNGWNHFWHHYTTVSNWKLYYDLTVRATKNGSPQTYNIEKVFESSDYDTNPTWEPDSIEAYDADTNALLYDAISMRKFILGYKNTRIEALFTNLFYVPTLANVTVVFGIEVFEEGGVQGRRRMSSKWASDADTWFKSLDLSNKTILSLVSGNTVKAEVLVDFTKIPLNKRKFKITARLYDAFAPCGEGGKKMEDGTCKAMEIGTIKQLE